MPMQSVLDLYEYAQEHQIRVDELDTGIGSFCIKRSQYAAIVMDSSEQRTEAETKADLAHELGHCETGSFYNIHSKLELRGKLERRADVWAIRQLVSEDELHQAVMEGNYEIWQLADYFDLPEPFMRKVVAYYEGIE